MKKIYYLFLGVLILGSTVMTSCSKDDDPKLSKSEMIAGTATTGKKWVVTAATSSVAGKVTDDFKDSDACERDDLFVFYSTKVYKENEGPTTCDATDSPVNSDRDGGTWAFNAGETELITTYIDGASSFSFTEKIKELSSSKMVLEYTSTDGTIYLSTYTAK